METVWVEALPEKAKLLRNSLAHFSNHQVVQTVAWSVSGENLSFNVASNGESSSVFQFGAHSTLYPEIRYTREVVLQTLALGELDFWDSDGSVFLNLDVQGAELEVMKGVGQSLAKCAGIYCEVNVAEVYKGIPQLRDIDLFLKAFGFIRVDWEINSEAGWGDALYLPEKSIPAGRLLRRSLRRTIRSRHLARVFRVARRLFRARL